MSFTVDSLLGPGGALEASMPGYEHRPEQLALAKAVARALDEKSYLLAEAGTGTGKTLAYLIPSLVSGKRVIISTATKTLQEQIFYRDLPLLAERAGLEVHAVHLKGRSNYLCLLKWNAFENEPRFASREEAEMMPTLKAWAAETDTGDRAEIDLPDAFATWPELSMTSESCLGPKCSLYESCFVTRMRRRAEEAQLVIVNHHLFFADLAIRGRPGRGEGILPAYEAVVFDEAHALEDVVTDYFGYFVSTHRLEDLAKDAQKALEGSDERSGTLQALAVKVRSLSDSVFRRVPAVLGMRGSEGSFRLTPSSLAPLKEGFLSLTQSLTALASFAMDAEDPTLSAISRRASDLARDLDTLHRASSLEHVFWAEARGRGVSLRAAPIEVAEPLREKLYDRLPIAIFTSATLTAVGRFDFFATRIGLRPRDGEERDVDDTYSQRRVRTLAVSSPFDFRTQAALYTPSHLPEPNAPGFVEAVAEELVALCNVTGGRAFFLFTSLRNMSQAYALTRDRLGCQVLVQGERPKSALLEAFRAEPSVLFASHSFWEGVDVPGDALSLVVIDKLPFASPVDPLVASRIELMQSRNEDPFSGYQVPRAAISLRQGFGRLIRTQADRGIVALLDPRLTRKRYGRAFIDSLPPAERVKSMEALEDWFDTRTAPRKRFLG